MIEETWHEIASVDDLLQALPQPLTSKQWLQFCAASCRRIIHLIPDDRYLRFVEINEAYVDGKRTREELLEVFEGMPRPATGIGPMGHVGIQHFYELPAWYRNAHQCVFGLAAPDILLRQCDTWSVPIIARTAIRAKAYDDLLGDHSGWQSVEAIEREVKAEIRQRSREAFELRHRGNSRFRDRELQAEAVAEEMTQRIRKLKDDIHADVAGQADAIAKREEAAQCAVLRCIIGNPTRPLVIDAAWRTTAVLGLAEAIRDDHAYDRMPILADALEEAGCDDPFILRHARNDSTHCRYCAVLRAI